MRSASRLSFVLGAVLLLAMAPRPAVAGLGGADLSVTLVDTPDPVTAGTNLTYTITVTNNGPDAALSASWSDTLPAGTTFASLSSPVGWSCTTPAPTSGGTVSCSTPSFAVGSAAFTLRVAVAFAATGSTISNTATVSAVITDPTPGNNSATATTTVDPVSTHLSITMAESAEPVAAGTYLQYTITVTNSGPGPADNVSWSDPLPAGTRFAGLSRPAGWSCSTPQPPEPLTPELAPNETVSCSIATLGVGSATFTLTVFVEFAWAGTILSNTANVTTTTADDPADNSATETTTITLLSLTVTDTPDPVRPGGNVTYTITATNPSSANLDAQLTLMWSGTSFVSLAVPDGWTCTPLSGLRCRNASWVPGSAVFTLVVNVPLTAPNGTSVGSSATINILPIFYADLASASASTTVRSVCGATKAVSPGSYAPGSTVTYTVELSHAGPGQQDNPGNDFTDVLLAGLTPVSATATSGTASVVGGNTVIWNGSIPAAGSVTITITATINPENVPGTLIFNQGSFSCDADGDGTHESVRLTDDPATSNPTTGGATDSTFFVVGRPETVSLVNRDFPDPVVAGTSLTYSISATNHTGANVGEPKITDPLPAGTTFESLGPVPAGWSCATPAVGANGSVVCSASSFASGTASFTINVKVDPSVPASTVLLSSAHLQVDDNNNITARNYYTTTAVIRRAVIRATKTVSGNFTPGGSVTYTVVLSNTGGLDTGDNATDEFTDVLSPSLSNITATATSGTTAVDPATHAVTWNGGIPAGASVTLTINATIDPAFPPGLTISSQGRAFYDSDGDGNNDSNVQTDDPATPGFDATTFQVGEGEPPVATNIPTLDETGFALLVLLLGMGGTLMLRRRPGGEGPL